MKTVKTNDNDFEERRKKLHPDTRIEVAYQSYLYNLLNEALEGKMKLSTGISIIKLTDAEFFKLFPDGYKITMSEEMGSMERIYQIEETGDKPTVFVINNPLPEFIPGLRCFE